MKVNKHVTKSDKSVLKTKDLKIDKLLKWCNSAGKQFHGLTALSAKNPLRTLSSTTFLGILKPEYPTSIETGAILDVYAKIMPDLQKVIYVAF